MSVAFDRIRHLLIDLDGVLYRGNAVLPHAVRFVSWLHDRGITFRLVTNNATLTPGQYVDKLSRMGIPVREEEVFTSALATALYLRQEDRDGRTAYVIGEEGLRSALHDAGIDLVEDRPDWVIVGLDRHLTYDKLAAAALAIEAGARFLGTNPDTSFPSERGLVPGAGAIQAALTATTGVQPVVVGKPHPLMLDLAMQQLGGTAQDTLMLGDRLDTDILGANALGMPSILVLTGVSTRDQAVQGAIHPDLIVNDLSELISLWEAACGRFLRP
jgi:4-nitrophenyl phosphatase